MRRWTEFSQQVISLTLSTCANFPSKLQSAGILTGRNHHFFHFFLDFNMMFLQQVSILLGLPGSCFCSLELNFYEPWMSPWRDAVKNGMARSTCCRKDSTTGQTVECCAEFVWNSSTPCLASDYHDTADWLEVWNALFEDAYLSRLSGWAHFLCLAVGKKPPQQKMNIARVLLKTSLIRLLR